MSRMRDGIVKCGSRWAFKIELPPDPATDKRRQKWVSGFDTCEASTRRAPMTLDVKRCIIPASVPSGCPTSPPRL